MMTGLILKKTVTMHHPLLLSVEEAVLAAAVVVGEVEAGDAVEVALVLSMKIENNMVRVNQIKDLMDHQRSEDVFRIISKAVKTRALKEVP